MKIPNWVKITLWLVLIAFFSWLLSQRYNAIINGTSNTTDIIIFLIWIALIAAFIFQEVDFFGVKLKREINNLRTDFKEQIINLRSDIQNTINMRTEISPHINVLTPSSDSELASIEERIRPVFEQVLKEQGIQKHKPTEEPQVPDDTQFLFSVRYAIENELKRIGKWLWTPPEERLYRTTLKIADILSMRGTINSQVVDIIREVYAICSSAIHGEDVSEASVKFVQDVSPPLIAYLKSKEEQLPEWAERAMQNWKPTKWPPGESPS